MCFCLILYLFVTTAQCIKLDQYSKFILKQRIKSSVGVGVMIGEWRKDKEVMQKQKEE